MKEMRTRAEASSTPESKPTPQPAPPSTPKRVEPPVEKQKTPLPVALVVALVGAGLFLLGSFLAFYNGVPGDETPKLINAMSGKVGLCLVLVAVLLVMAKKLQTIAAIAASLALGAVLAAAIDVTSGDALVVKLSSALAHSDVTGGVGMYAALFGAAIVLLAVFMISKKKPKSDNKGSKK
jgi:hypothetical protein